VPAVHGVLELAGFLTILKVEPDLESAISAAAG
jgi:hypothetical protein